MTTPDDTPNAPTTRPGGSPDPSEKTSRTAALPPHARRPPLTAVPGLARDTAAGNSRTAGLPGPPARRPSPATAPPPAPPSDPTRDDDARTPHGNVTATPPIATARVTPSSADVAADGQGSELGSLNGGAALARRARRPGRRPVSAEADVSRPITLSLPAALVVQLKAHARAEQLSQPEVLLDALAAARDHLGDLMATHAPPASSDGLFVRRATPRTSTEPMATLSMRMLGPNVDVIDQLVTTHNAPSRSALCAAALRHYLTPPH